MDGSALAALPAAYLPSNAWFFEIQTSVVNGDNKEVCVLFQTTSYTAPSTVALLRLSGSSWTLLAGQRIVDLDSNQGTICGYTPTFGTFALVERTLPTATPTATSTRTTTPTNTPSNTATASNTPIPTHSLTPTATSTSTQTLVPSVTPTQPPIPSASATATSTSSPAPSSSPSSTATQIITASPTVTASWTITSSPTPTSTASSTTTSTSTRTQTATPTHTPTLGPGSYPTGTSLRTTTRVNLRSGPSTSSTSLTVLVKDVTVTVTGASVAAQGYTWVPVSVPSVGTGWIAGNYLSAIAVPTATRTATTPTATSIPKTTSPTTTPIRPPGGFIAGDFVRTTASLNLRSAPNTSSRVLQVLPNNAVGQVTGPGVANGGNVFYPVMFDGRPAGYVAGKYLQRITSTPTPSRTATPTATLSGLPSRWAKTDVNMRSGPGTGYRVVAKIPEGTRISVMGAPQHSGGYDWYPVAVFGVGSGWIAGKYLTTQGPV